MKTSASQRKATAKWRARHKALVARYRYKSDARKFVTNYATVAECRELVQLAYIRYKALQSAKGTY